MAEQEYSTLIAEILEGRRRAEEGVCPCDEAFRQAYPDLWTILTQSWVEAGKRVELGSIRIFNSLGDWAFQITSPGIKASKTILVQTFTNGLETLEKAVRGREPPWQYWLKHKAEVKVVEPEKNGSGHKRKRR